MRRGFTLIEVMIAVVVMGISACGVALAVNKGMKMQKHYADIMIMNDLTIVDQAVSIYRRLYGSAPGDIEDLSDAHILTGEYSDYILSEKDGAIIPVKHFPEGDMSLDDYLRRHKK